MKKSTAFLKKNFRKEFSREDNYRINGRKLCSLLDKYSNFYEQDNKLLVNENMLLNDASRDNEIRIVRLSEEVEAMNLLIDQQTEIILDQTNDLLQNEGIVSKYRSYCGWFALLSIVSILVLAYFLVTYTLDISIF